MKLIPRNFSLNYQRIMRHRAVKGVLAAAALLGVAGVAHRAALAQALLQQQGTLAPMEDSYEFQGEAGQAMTIELESQDFDTVLLLKGPNGEVIASNDDYGNATLNSTIVIELPESGSYSAVASSFSGQGGDYEIEVRPASEYEQVFSRAYELTISEDFGAAIEAYTAAIELDDSDPGAYLGRAAARLDQAYINAEVTATGDLENLPEAVTSDVVADYLKAADLIEQQGDPAMATSIREQAQYFSGELAAPVESSPMPNDDAAGDDMDEDTAGGEIEVDQAPDSESDMMMPVEPDGGIGDGAEPLSE